MSFFVAGEAPFSVILQAVQPSPLLEDIDNDGDMDLPMSFGATENRAVAAAGRAVADEGETTYAHFGLGASTRTDALRVAWPDGAVNREVVVTFSPD